MGRVPSGVYAAVRSLVMKDSLLGTRLRLTKNTYFCDAQVVPLHYIRTVLPDVCPGSDLLLIEDVAVDARKRQARAHAARQATAPRKVQHASSGQVPQTQQQSKQAPQQQMSRQRVTSDPDDDPDS